MEWLLGLAFQYLFIFSIPYLYGIATDWPWHFGISGIAGSWAFFLTWIISHVSWRYFSGEAPSQRVVRFIWLRCCLWAVFASVAMHCLRDYWLVIIRFVR